MPIKLIIAIALVVIVAVLTGFNLGNTSDVWLFYKFENIPIIYTALTAFVAGVLVTLPFTFGKKRGRKQDEVKPQKVSKREQKKNSPAAGLKDESSASVPAESSESAEKSDGKNS